MKTRYTAKFLVAFVLLISESSCRMLGIHFKVENPSKAGKYPKFTEAQRLLANPGNKRNCYDVSYYKLDIKIDPAKKTLGALVQINARLVSASDTLQLDLAKRLKIKQITVNGEPATFTRREGAVFFKPATKIFPNQSFSVLIDYEGKPVIAKHPPWKGGTVWKKDKDGKSWCGVACESEGASIWWPNKDDVADEPDSADVWLTTSNDLLGVSNGVLRGIVQNNNQTQTAKWHVSYPINNYNITYYVGNYKLIEDTFYSKATQDTLLMSYYVLPKNLGIAKGHFQQVKKHLAFYEKAFGPYPWPRDGFKFVESPYAGMEHQTAIAYGSGYKNGHDGFDYIILHETAHEWWGNSLTASDLSDAWLQEGFATYAEALYVESTKGHKAYLDYLFWQRLSICNKRPVVRPRGIRYFSAEDEDVYVKGSWILHSLRTVIKDDSLFFDILKTFRMQNHCKQILSEKFIDLVNQKTETDYSWFFNQYLYQREAPILEYYWNGRNFYYRWKTANADFDKLPVVIQSGKVKKVIYPSKQIQSIQTDSNWGETFVFNNNLLLFGNVVNSSLK